MNTKMMDVSNQRFIYRNKYQNLFTTWGRGFNVLDYTYGFRTDRRTYLSINFHFISLNKLYYPEIICTLTSNTSAWWTWRWFIKKYFRVINICSLQIIKWEATLLSLYFFISEYPYRKTVVTTKSPQKQCIPHNTTRQNVDF